MTDAERASDFLEDMVADDVLSASPDARAHTLKKLVDLLAEVRCEEREERDAHISAPRLKGLVVALAEDTRGDSTMSIVNAIRMVKGVLDVEPIESTSNDWIERQRVRDELSTKLWEVLHPESS